MPKVLRIINRFNLGGPTYNVSYLSKYMPEEYETLLIGGPEEAGEESSLFIPESLGLKPLIIEEMRRSVNPLADYYAYRKIRQIIGEFKPDIVHTHASKAGALGRLAAFHSKVPVIVHTFHGHVFNNYFSPVKTRIFKKIERELAKRTSAIVTISNLQKEELCSVHKICDPSKTFVIPLGFDLERFAANIPEKRKLFRERYGIKEDEIAVTIIGRLAPIKNHKLFIDALHYAINNSDKKIRGIIVGDGETRESICAYIESKNLKWSDGKTASDFVFTSWMKEADVALAGADLVALSSLNEGTPVSLIEAQAAGKYIVSTNVGGIKDILEEGAGLLSEPADEKLFLENMLTAIHSITELRTTSRDIQNKVMQKFSYHRLCKDMDSLYKKLLSEKR